MEGKEKFDIREAHGAPAAEGEGGIGRNEAPFNQVPLEKAKIRRTQDKNCRYGIEIEAQPKLVSPR